MWEAPRGASSRPWPAIRSRPENSWRRTRSLARKSRVPSMPTATPLRWQTDRADPRRVQTERQLVEKANAFWRLTGGNTMEMGPAEHDTHLAAHQSRATLGVRFGSEDGTSPGSSAGRQRMDRHDPRRSRGPHDVDRDLSRESGGDSSGTAAILRRTGSVFVRSSSRKMTRPSKSWLAEAQEVKQQTP